MSQILPLLDATLFPSPLGLGSLVILSCPSPFQWLSSQAQDLDLNLLRPSLPMLPEDPLQTPL